jgi:hypothetical protein
MSLKDLLDFAPQAEAFFKDYLIAALVLLFLGLLAAWWFRGVVDAGEIRGLKEGLNALRDQLAVRDERLQLASEKEKELTHAVEQATEISNHLQAQIKSKADLDLLSAIATKTAQAIGQIAVANSALRGLLGTKAVAEIIATDDEGKEIRRLQIEATVSHAPTHAIVADSEKERYRGRCLITADRVTLATREDQQCLLHLLVVLSKAPPFSP